MSIAVTLQIKSISSGHTEALAHAIGHNLRGGETLELVSDVGGGKTTFTRGLVAGAGSSDVVGSPTFTISRQYAAPRFTMFHFDFYRLTEAGIVANELAEVVDDALAVTVVEWGDIVHDVLPGKRLTIRFELVGETDRTITLSCPPDLGYLLEGIAG